MEGKVKSVVLVGRTGNGKSATGNTILGRKEFISRMSAASVTIDSALKSATLEDGQILNVIDTPGLFDFIGNIQSIGNEIAKCMDLAKDGLDAIVLVLSIRDRFTREEEAAVKCLRSFFGPKIVDYMIVVFTGGDALEDDVTLQSYLGDNCPEPLKETLAMCGNREILFNNKTGDEAEKSKQRNQFLSLLNKVVEKNGRVRYTDKLFTEVKEKDVLLGRIEAENRSEEKEKLVKLYEEQLQRITGMIERKFEASLDELRRQLAEEQKARQDAIQKYGAQITQAKVQNAEAQGRISSLQVQMDANEKINKLQIQLAEAKIREELQPKPVDSNESDNGCAIL